MYTVNLASFAVRTSRSIYSYIFILQAAVGFELWSMTEDILFDNVLITDDISVANKLAEDRLVLNIN